MEIKLECFVYDVWELCWFIVCFAWHNLKQHLALLIKHLFYKKFWLKSYDGCGGNQGLDQWSTCPNFDGSN